MCAFNVNGTVVHFYYAGGQRVEERDGSNNVLEDYMFDRAGQRPSPAAPGAIWNTVLPV